jgi:hypothetical protein
VITKEACPGFPVKDLLSPIAYPEKPNSRLPAFSIRDDSMTHSGEEWEEMAMPKGAIRVSVKSASNAGSVFRGTERHIGYVNNVEKVGLLTNQIDEILDGFQPAANLVQRVNKGQRRRKSKRKSGKNPRK